MIPTAVAWTLVVLVGGPVLAGLAAGVAIDAGLSMWELRRAGEHLAATPEAPRG